ncbi:Hypothetical protein GL50581_3280 [Giardia duodenalis ATCC 50581]|uniref:Uncharacterized protein n=1 Tax=Giardia intestinalis (strain ATCC 50581 / GS clone H7) TaxID=598745 RepID=C6LWW6_GIAIB|nr:Hypothetical protein GL50581_3280 [Giardia intestinalis ATCC 50581]
MNGASITRRLMVVASVQHVGESTRIPLPQTTLIHAIVVGVQDVAIKNLTLDYNLTKRALPFSSTLPGEYLVDHVIPYHEVVPGSESILQIDLSYPDARNRDTEGANYILVYGISFDIRALSPLGRFLPEIISLLCCYEAESTRIANKLEYPLLFTLYSAGYAAYHGRKYLKADSYFKRLVESIGSTLLSQRVESAQQLDVNQTRILASLTITRLIAVVELNKSEKRYEAALSFYDTMRWFFLTLLDWYRQSMGNIGASETHAKLFHEYYAHLIDTLSCMPVQARHLVSLETCILSCVYDLLFLLILDSAETLTSAQLSELFSTYSPNSSMALSMLCANYKQLINFSNVQTIFGTVEKASAVIYLLDLILQSSMMSLQPEILKLIITPFILQLTSSSTESQFLSGQTIAVLQSVQDRLSCFSATSLFRFFVDLFGIFDPAILLKITDLEEGQFLYTFIVDILNILGTAQLAIDFTSFFPLSQQSGDHKFEGTRVYWDLERYVKSFSYLAEVTVIILRQIRHTYIYFHTLNRKYNKLLGACKADPDQAHQDEALGSLKEKFHVSSKEIESLLAFRKNSLSPLYKQLDLATKLNTLLGNTFGTVLLRSQDWGVVPSHELVSSLNSYLYKCSACIGLVLCNLDEIPIRGVSPKDQALYAKGLLEKQPHDVQDITVLAPLLIDFKLSELIESKMLVYKPLSTDIFKYPNLSNAILHILGNFFAGFGFCASMTTSSSFLDKLHTRDTSREVMATPTVAGGNKSVNNIHRSPLSSPTTSPYQQEYGRGQMLPQLNTEAVKMSCSVNSSTSTEQEPHNAYLSLIKYYYSEISPELPFLKPITILLNTLFASGIILGNRIAHRSKEERVYHCSLSISDLGLEKLASTELYSFAENIWYFVRYYSNSLFQCTTYSDLLFGAYILEFIRFSRSSSLNEVLLCQFINYSQLYWSDSLAPAECLAIKSLESCFPAFILLDLPSIREISDQPKSTQLSVQKALSWFQSISCSTSRLYVLIELLYTAMQQILRHSKYQMFPECYGLIGRMLHLFEALLDRLYELDSGTIEAYMYTKHYIEVLCRLVAKISVHLSTRFIPSTHFYKDAAKDAASLLISGQCLKYYNDTLFLLINNQLGTSTVSDPDFYLSIPFIANILESALFYNLYGDAAKSHAVSCQVLKLVMLSWHRLKSVSFLNSTNVCSFACVCAFLTLFELIVFPSSNDTTVLDISFSIFTDLHEYFTFPLFFLAYTKALAGQYLLFFNERFSKHLGTSTTIHEAKLTKFLGIYTAAVKSAACARIHLYASMFIQKLLSTTHICKLLSYKERQELQTLYTITEMSACGWNDGALDLEDCSADSLLIELETPINNRFEDATSVHKDALSAELLSVPNPKDLSDVSIIPLISNGQLQEMRPHHIPQTELPHYSSIVDLKLAVATQYAIVFSFVIPFTGAKEATALLDLPNSIDGEKSSADTFIDRIDGIKEDTLNKKVKLLMGHDMPTYSITTPLGEQVEKRYNVVYSKRLLELVPNGIYACTSGDLDEGVTTQPTPSSKAPVIKTNELTRRYMSKEERDRRAQYLLQNALDEFAEETQSTVSCEPLQEEDLSSEVAAKPAIVTTNLDNNLLRASTDSDGQDCHENKVQNKIEDTFCAQADKDHASVKECIGAEFSGDDDEYVKFNADDDTVEGQLPDSIVEALRRS